ncbi:DUF4292 domain-containing protein [Thermophagus sp. OGC60D27]|uniref:DUF4292 domain-containing protein n=1 Tax=Thermophagus sp. OGC60D27 TaxID=3458415 RepID=UPI004037F208
MNRKYFTILFFIAFLFGCRTVEKVKEGDYIAPLSGEKIVGMINELDEKRDIENIFFKKAFFTFKSSNSTKSFKCRLFLDVDSFIRISVLGPVGIEVARISFEPEKVTVIDRINRKIIYTDFEELYRKFHLDIDFFLLQNFLLNRSFSFYENMNLGLEDYFYCGINNRMYKYSSMKEKRIKKLKDNQLLNDFSYHQFWLMPESFNLKKNYFYFKEGDLALTIDYDDFKRDFSSFLFPMVMNIEGNYAERNFHCNLVISDIVFNGDQQISFSIPQKYDKIYR